MNVESHSVCIKNAGIQRVCIRPHFLQCEIISNRVGYDFHLNPPHELYVHLKIGMNILFHMLLHTNIMNITNIILHTNIMNANQRRMDIIGRKNGAQQL